MFFQLDDGLSRGTLLWRTALTGVGGAVILAAAMMLLAGKDLSSTWRSLRRQSPTRALQSEAESLSGAP
jgi:hypothetical protein